MRNIEPKALREASQARKHAAALYLFNPRVTLIDIGWRIVETEGRRTTDELAVRIHLRQKPRGAILESFAERHPELFINKGKIPFPVDIVEGVYPLHWHMEPNVPPTTRGQAFNPLLGGISISTEWSSGYGTLGGLVLDRESDTPMVLSNWHVLAGSAYVRRGLKILQPGYGDGGRDEHAIGHLERHAMDDGIDAAVAKLTQPRKWTNDQLDVGAVTGAGMPRLGAQVLKSGRGSEVTYGMIDGVEGEYPIRYGGFWHTIKYVCRIVPRTTTSEVSRPGDSGSWWLEEGTKNALALHFAGNNDPETALAIAMPPVLDSLKVDIALGGVV